MKTENVIMVRIYLTEAEGNIDTLIKRLHDWGKVRGVTVFHGSAGFGPSGRMHLLSAPQIARDLPMVVEFFDEPTKVEEILETLSHIIKPGHVVCWPAKIIVEDKQ
jgi:PII-like signaling protein